MPAEKTPKAKKKTANKAVTKAVSNGHAVGVMVEGRNGGKIWRGAPANPVAGPGRPTDEIRAKLRELGLAKSIPFLSDLLDGKVKVSLEGKCDACGHEQPISAELMEQWHERVKASIDHQLKATEYTLKHGLAAKELVITSQNASGFFDCVHRAIVELYGDAGAEQVKARALALMEQSA